MSGVFANNRRFDDGRDFQLGASGRRDPTAGETPVEKSAANAVDVFADTLDVSTGADDGRSLDEALELLCRCAAGDEDAKREAVEGGSDAVDTSKFVIKNRHKGRRSTYPPGTFDGV